MTIYKRTIEYPGYQMIDYYQTLANATNCIKNLEQLTSFLRLGKASQTEHIAVITSILVND